MLKLICEFKNRYKVEDTETRAFRFLTATQLLMSLVQGLHIEGCEFGPGGLSLTVDGVTFDVYVEVYRPVSIYNEMEDSVNYRYEVSNLGRVRQNIGIDVNGRCLPERILSSRVPKYGVSRIVRLSVGGKVHSVSLARLVAAEFLPNPQNLAFAVRKNNTLDDYGVWNLQWSSGNKWANVHNRGRKRTPVRQYTLDGEFVKEWTGVMDAVRSFGGKSSSIIADVCNRKPGSYTAYGFIWRYPNDDEYYGSTVKIPIVKYITAFNKAKCKPVRQYTKEGTFVAEYCSCAEASEKTGILDTSIGQVCNRIMGHYTAGGYIWRYPSDDEFASKG